MALFLISLLSDELFLKLSALDTAAAPYRATSAFFDWGDTTNLLIGQ